MEPPLKRRCGTPTQQGMENDPTQQGVANDLLSGLNEEQKQAFQKAQSGESLFITGGAGTGKSFVLSRIIAALHRLRRRVIVTASTGLAASQYEHGRTVHSLINSPDRMIIPEEETMLTIVIDEMSMVSSALLDKLASEAAKANSSSVWPPKLQLLCVGDFFQLGPVEVDNVVCFAFESRTWATLKLQSKSVVLTASRRQEDDVGFVSFLNRLRLGICTRSDVATLNEVQDLPEEDVDSVAHIYCTNAKVEMENKRRVEEMSGKDGNAVRNYDMLCFGVFKKGKRTKNGTKLLKQVVEGSTLPPIQSRIAESSGEFFSSRLDMSSW